MGSWFVDRRVGFHLGDLMRFDWCYAHPGRFSSWSCKRNFSLLLWMHSSSSRYKVSVPGTALVKLRGDSALLSPRREEHSHSATSNADNTEDDSESPVRDSRGTRGKASQTCSMEILRDDRYVLWEINRKISIITKESKDETIGRSTKFVIAWAQRFYGIEAMSTVTFGRGRFFQARPSEGMAVKNSPGATRRRTLK
ncbi:hypothetical protein KM043_006335 [Ampulex compressa]|nr:hypothetical protein KM043_006335 [Ampulex compressa]